MNIGSVIQLLAILKKTTATKDDIAGLWEVFKIQNLTGDKPYNGESDVYRHFTNWAKDLKIEKYGAVKQADGTTRFNAGALELLRKGKEKFAAYTREQDGGT